MLYLDCFYVKKECSDLGKGEEEAKECGEEAREEGDAECFREVEAHGKDEEDGEGGEDGDTENAKGFIDKNLCFCLGSH